MALPAPKYVTIDWNKENVDAEVLISNGRSLFLSARGPPRRDNQPVIIIEAGMGDGLRSWSAVQSQVSKFARVFSYDRAGIGRSEPPPEPRTAATIASELSSLLEAAKISPPYIIICHSYGGLLAREFLATRQPDDDVVGMIFVDTNTEKIAQELAVPWESLFAVCGDLDYYVETGLEAEHKLDPVQWAAMKAEEPKNKKTSDQENKEEATSARELAAKHQFEQQVLRNRPVVVIKGNSSRDYQRIYDAGIAAGNGTESQRADVRHNDMAHIMEIMDPIEERLQKEQLQLSSSGWYTSTAMTGHNIMLTEPELIVEEVKKVLKTLESRHKA